MKSKILVTCLALMVGIGIGRTTVATPEMALVKADTAAGDVATSPIFATTADASGSFGYGPIRTTDW